MKEDSDQRIVEKILQFISLENKQVLEIGCGNGRITSLLVGKPKKLTAIEPDAEKIREARKKIAGVNFQVGTGENLEFSDKCFDVVIFTLSLHHQDSRVAISEAKRVLRNGGNILVIEPTSEGEIEQVFALLQNEDQEKLEAQKSINESGLILERSDVFKAKWMFENQEELYQTLFEYYDMPFDDSIAKQIMELLGTKLETSPIKLMDTMIIQSLKRVA